MNIRSIYKIILFLFISSLGFGQSLSFINYTVESHGLAQNSVFSIFQDSRGFIWFATEGGLSKFDGSEFRNYDEGLIDKDILSISEDSKGAIWVGTTKNLTKIVNDTITNYTIRGQVVNSFSDAPDDDFDFVYDIVEDSNNTYFFTTRNNGVFTIDSMGFRPYEILADVKYTREFIIDQGHGLWITTEGNGVYSVKGDELTNYRTSDGLISDSTWSILELENGEIVIGCVDGYTVFKDNKFVQPKNVPSYMNDRISAIVEDKDGNLWFGTYNNGLVFYDGYEYQNYGRENGLPNDVVYSAIEDLRGDLWIGMQDGGAARLAVEKFKVYSSKNGLAADNIFSILRDSGGDLWFGHLGEGISRMTDDGVELYNTENGFLDNGIPTMIESQNGDIWIGTMSGLARYRNDKFKYYDQSDSLFSSLFVLSLLEDSQGKLWVGGEGGIKIYDPTTDKFIEEPRLREIYSDNPEIWVTNIYEDNNGFIWFSTSDKGVFQYNGRTVKRIGVENGLPSPYVFQVIQTPDNTFWFCTDQGLVRYVDQKATVITSSQGLSNNTCYFALSEKDYLYIGTGNGISRLAYLDFESKGKDAFKIYNNRDGIAASEMNMFAFHKDKNNNLYFGSKNGVTSFNPNDVPRFLPSNVYIKKITISDDESDKDTLTNIELELDYTQDNLTIEYQAIVFTSQEKIRYQIRLDPLDNRPSETQISEASFRSLPAGDYTFRVKCLNADGIWSDEETTFSFIIYPPFWETWWFRTIIILALVSGVYLFYDAKTKQVRRRNIELANMVRDRTKDLEVQKNKSDELLLNILPSSLVHELKSHGSVIPRKFNSVSILFTDFKGFTQTSSILPADRLVDELNEIFFGFDQLMGEFELEKLKTIGDAYMAAGGLPTETEDHAIRVTLAALRMQDLILKRNEHAALKWEMRVGIHTGTVVAGVVGTRKFTYDIWGDTVNIASRMESSGEPNRVNISAFTYMLIKDYFECEYRGKIDAKGKGVMDMYFVNGVKEKIHQVYNYDSLSA